MTVALRGDRWPYVGVTFPNWLRGGGGSARKVLKVGTTIPDGIIFQIWPFSNQHWGGLNPSLGGGDSVQHWGDSVPARRLEWTWWNTSNELFVTRPSSKLWIFRAFIVCWRGNSGIMKFILNCRRHITYLIYGLPAPGFEVTQVFAMIDAVNW